MLHRAAAIALATAVWAYGQSGELETKALAARIAAEPSASGRQALLAGQNIDASLVTALQTYVDAAYGHADYASAFDLAHLRLQLARRISDRDLESQALNSLGTIARMQVEFDQAAEFYRQSAAIAEQTGNSARLAVALVEISTVLRNQGDYTASLEQGNRARSIAQSIDGKLTLARAENSLGATYLDMGRYAPAREHMESALRLSEEIKSRDGIAFLANNLGTLFEAQGEYELALQYYERSLKIKEQLNNRVSLITTLHNMGEVNHRMGRQTLAAQYYNRALEIATEAGQDVLAARSLVGLASVEAASGRKSQALEYGGRSIATATKTSLAPLQSEVLSRMASIFLLLGERRKALDAAQRSLEIAERIGDSDAAFSSEDVAGDASEGLGLVAEARTHYRTAVKIIEEVRDQMSGSADEARSFLRNNVAPYQGLARLDLARGDVGSAFQWTERAKSRALADVLSGGHVTATKSMTVVEREEESRLRRILVRNNERLSRAKEGDIPRAREQIDSARLDFTAFENALYARHTELRTNRARMEAVSARALAELLPGAYAVFLGYTVTERESWLFLITKTGKPRFFRLPAGMRNLSQRVEIYRQKLSNHDLGIRSDARELFALLLAPVSEEIRRADLIVIAPDGPLWQVPFQALEGTDGRPLIASSALTYTPSASVLAGILRRRGGASLSRDPRMLLMSYGVEGAEEETRDIARIYGGPVHANVIAGAASSESLFKSEAASYRSIHIAAHGKFDDRSPMYSGISLAKDGDDDGHLEAWELMNMDLHASLVVLSACETARGAVNSGEGLVGITWALFVAGVPATIASNWEVDSKATRELMTGLHRGLRAGLTPAAALRDSALKLMVQPAYRHPFYWASFSVFGAGF